MRRPRLLLFVLILLVLVVAGGVVTYGLVSDPACPSGESSPVPVLVAQKFIPTGTSGSAILKRRLYVTAAIACGDRKAGAIADPAELLGQVTTVDLLPGQQFTDADVSAP